MNVDDALLMACADGELGPIERARIEEAMADDPSIGNRLAAFAMLGDRLRDAFAPIATAPVPDRLTTMIDARVVGIHRRPPARRWQAALAMAASLVLGVGVGTQWTARSLPVAVDGGTLVAAGPLAHALDTQLASAPGDVRVLVSFRSATDYCRVFASAAADGIACRAGDGWQLRQTRSGSAVAGGAYRQAASADAALMTAAQDMMTGAPLDGRGERRARAAGWR